MSTPVDTSFTGLKASVAKIMAIISGARLISPGPIHFALGSQVSALVAHVVKEYVDGPLPGIVWPNWHSIRYDDPCVLKHAWHSKVLAWKLLGDYSCDLPMAAPPLTGPIPVDLPSPPVLTGNVAGLSTNPTTEFRDKGKGSRKRKYPMISESSSQPPKSAMKTHKHMRSTRIVKSKAFVELEDDDEPIMKPFLGAVPEVVLPRLSTIVARTPNLPRSSWAPTKKTFGPATAIAGSRPAVVEPSQASPETPVEAPSAIDVVRPSTNTTHRTTHARLATSKTGPAQLGLTGGLDTRACHVSTARQRRSSASPRFWEPRPNALELPLPPGGRGPGHLPRLPPKRPLPRNPRPELATQTRGHSKTITAVKAPASAPAPAPAPAPHLSSSLAVPRAALDMPIPDLHGMAIAIWDAAAQIAILEAHVAEQDGAKSSTSTPHSHFQTLLPMQHPCCLIKPSLSPCHPPQSALPPFVDLPMAGVEPTPPKIETPYAIANLMFELSQVQPPPDPLPTPLGPLISMEIVDVDDPGNLVPEYDSDDDMDVEVKVEEVKVEVSTEEIDMAT
ncbi:hypothetical protein EV702DRAFT_1200853 [Suillus placidus]|uniref:Uncharacterized protein n=1 Tax=Suillus placidus TaxID=48579 RepID=A0A9P6ZNL3_9AGAM|nr:hypothetical protein EV702DRAFT_1200853 [Suillus placidus]